MSKRWYVVHAYSGMEKSVGRAIQERIDRAGMQSHFGRILVPTEEVVEMKNGQRTISERRFFPGYVFVEMDLTDESWHLVKNTNKVTGFVGGSGHLRLKRFIVPSAVVSQSRRKINPQPNGHLVGSNCKRQVALQAIAIFLWMPKNVPMLSRANSQRSIEAQRAKLLMQYLIGSQTITKPWKTPCVFQLLMWR